VIVASSGGEREQRLALADLAEPAGASLAISGSLSASLPIIRSRPP